MIAEEDAPQDGAAPSSCVNGAEIHINGGQHV